MNDASHRKTPVSVFFNEGEQLVGIEAFNKVLIFSNFFSIYLQFIALMFQYTKKPKQVYHELLPLLGRTFDDSIFQQIKSNYLFSLVELPDRPKHIGIPLDENITFAVEDLLGMVLNNAKEIASKNYGSSIKDFSITVKYIANIWFIHFF